MGINPMTIAMLSAGAGTVMQGIGGVSEARSGQRRADRLENRIMGQVQEGPGFLESLLRSQFNPGQDGGMQTARGIPGGHALTTMAETGMPFDTSEFFEALAPLRARQQNESLAGLRAGASGLGERFGSSMMRGEEQTVRELLETIAAQDSATQFQAHESASNRQLQASGIISNLMQLLGGLEQNRRGMNLQAIGAAGGIPQPGSQWSAAGQPFMDIGQMLLMLQLLGRDKPKTTTTGLTDTVGTPVPSGWTQG